VTTRLRKAAIFALTIVAALCIAGTAHALSFEDIAGKWCGEVSSYVFARDKLTVILLSDSSQRTYPVDEYEYDDEVVTVTWKRGDDPFITEFGEFGADRQSMVQLENDVGPRREFHRCS
jgi:hypothetical protein